MDRSLIDIIGDMLAYIFNIKLFDAPLLIAELAVAAMVGYCASLIVIGFPCSIYEALAKKKVNGDIEKKVIKGVAICFVVVLWVALLYQLSS